MRLRRPDYVSWQRGVLCSPCTYVQHDNCEALAWSCGGSGGSGCVGRGQLESGGLKPDFCLCVDLAHKAQCGLTLKIININVVPGGLNNFNNIVGVWWRLQGQLEPHKVFDDCQ